MPAAAVNRTVDVPPDRLWALLADFGDVSWMPAGTEVKLEGEGVGMTRVVGGAIRESLAELDHATRTLVYTIADEGCPFPASGYRSTVRVREAEGGAQIDWSAEAEPVGDTTPEQLKAIIEGLYGTMIGWIVDRVKAG